MRRNRFKRRVVLSIAGTIGLWSLALGGLNLGQTVSNATSGANLNSTHLTSAAVAGLADGLSLDHICQDAVCGVGGQVHDSVNGNTVNVLPGVGGGSI